MASVCTVSVPKLGWNYGVGVPSGLFVPSLLTGSAFGRIVGQLLTNHLKSENARLEGAPGTYALVGACAMLAGTARITISLAGVSLSQFWAVLEEFRGVSRPFRLDSPLI